MFPLSRASLTAAFLVAPFLAQRAEGQSKVFIAAGMTVPTSPFSDTRKTGFNLSGGLAFAPPVSPVGFRVEVNYNEFDSKFTNGAKSRATGVVGNVDYGFSGSIGPYVTGGIGYYGGSNITSGTGFNVGGGFKFELTGFAALLEARYHRVNDNTTFIPITFGVVF